MKVVVLDDEEKVLKLICALIKWEELGLELVGTAGDGLDGLKLIKEKEPDILITDIRMPSLDGLELLEQAKLSNPNLQVIIISGYRQFDYAKKAIKFGVSDYLLKPIKQDELINALKKMISKLNENLNYSNYLTNKDELRRHYLLSYLENEVNKDKLEELFSLKQYFLISLLVIDGEFAKYDLDARAAIREKINYYFVHFFKEEIEWDFVFSTKFHGYLLFLSFDEEEKDIVLSLQKKAFNEAKISSTQLFDDNNLYISQGNIFSKLETINQQLDFIKKQSLFRFDESCDNYILDKDILFKIDDRFVDSFIISLNSILSESKLNMNELDLLMNKLNSLDNIYFFFTITTIIEKVKSVFYSQIGEDSFKNITFEEINYYNNKKALIGFLKEQFIKIYNIIINIQQNESVKPIKVAKKYISENYNDNQLSLDYISSLVHLSPSYFSSLFKKETNKGFAEYLREIRIEESAKFLTTTTLPIKEIAKKVGYQDPRHFTKCFKNQIGIKPQDYRKLYG
ncbi:MAG: response regulator transcription factor [Pleomorphochaeta sp.]